MLQLGKDPPEPPTCLQGLHLLLQGADVSRVASDVSRVACDGRPVVRLVALVVCAQAYQVRPHLVVLGLGLAADLLQLGLQLRGRILRQPRGHALCGKGRRQVSGMCSMSMILLGIA